MGFQAFDSQQHCYLYAAEDFAGSLARWRQPHSHAAREKMLAVTHLDLVAIVVRDYDRAIRFFVDVLGFELVDDSPSLTNDGRPKRWVVVRPPDGQTGLLLAQANGDRQLRAAGDQVGGRVGFFLRVDDFDESYQQMVASGVEFLSEPRTESYGEVAVFLDVEGNRWDLLSG